MKVKDGFMLREVAGCYVVVPTGRATLDFSGIITLNGSGAFLWKQLEENREEPNLLQALLEEYDIDENTAKEDITDFLAKLKAADLLE